MKKNIKEKFRKIYFNKETIFYLYPNENYKN